MAISVQNKKNRRIRRAHGARTVHRATFDRLTPTARSSHVRWYDPTVGRWLSEDPAAADENLYRYCGNAPTDGIDPSGLMTKVSFAVPLIDGKSHVVGGWESGDKFACLLVDGKEKEKTMAPLQQGTYWGNFDYTWLKRTGSGTVRVETEKNTQDFPYTTEVHTWSDWKPTSHWNAVENLGINFVKANATGKYTEYTGLHTGAAVWTTNIGISVDWDYSTEAGKGQIQLHGVESILGDTTPKVNYDFTKQQNSSLSADHPASENSYYTDAVAEYRASVDKWFSANATFAPPQYISVGARRTIDTGYTGAEGWNDQIQFKLPGVALS